MPWLTIMSGIFAPAPSQSAKAIFNLASQGSYYIAAVGEPLALPSAAGIFPPRGYAAIPIPTRFDLRTRLSHAPPLATVFIEVCT